MTNIKTEMMGKYRVQVLENNEVIHDTGEFSNLITDLWFADEDGLDANHYYVIGTGVVTAPTTTDTSLGNQVGVSSNSYGSPVSEIVDIDGVSYAKTNLQPNDITGVSGDVTEIGLRRGSPSGNLVSRSLVKDASGNPSSVTIASDQTLRLSYSLYFKLPAGDVATGTINVGGVNYPWRAYITNNNASIVNEYNSPLTGGVSVIKGYRMKVFLQKEGLSYASGISPTATGDTYDPVTGIKETWGEIAATTNNRTVVRIAQMAGFQREKETVIFEFTTPIPLPANNKFSYRLSYSRGRAS